MFIRIFLWELSIAGLMMKQQSNLPLLLLVVLQHLQYFFWCSHLHTQKMCTLFLLRKLLSLSSIGPLLQSG